MVTLETNISASDLEKIKLLYLDSFPAEERRPWPDVIDPITSGGPQLMGVYYDGRLAGMVTVWQFDGWIYIEHLAIIPSMRGHSIGSKVIMAVRNKYNQLPIVVEIEPPTQSSPQTLSRLRFYERLGFIIIDRNYVQPPYAEGLDSVALYLLATAKLDATQVTRNLHSRVYGRTTN